MEVKVFVKRSKDDFTCVLTIQEYENNKLVRKAFDRIPCRSGSPYWTPKMGEWVRKKSPIPVGKFNLNLQPTNVGMKPGKTGMGEFFPIDSEGDAYTIKGKGKGQIREEIGLHAENAIPGSLGCVVVLNQGHFDQISEYLKTKAKDGIKKVSIEVFF